MIGRTALLLAVLSCDADSTAATSSASEGGGGEAGTAGAPSGSTGAGGQGGEPSEVLAKLEQIVAALVDPTGTDPNRAPGLVAIYVSPTEQHVVGAGVLAPDGPPVTGESVFQLGSVSKAITGLILAAQAVEGLDVERPANELLGPDVQLPNFGGVEISLEHLVSHYGALPNFPMPPTGPPTSPFAGYSRANLASFLDGLTLSAPPGSDYAYSNLGSGTLGLALADAFAGGSYRTLLADNIAVPFGMSDTDVGDPEFLDSVSDRLVTGHQVQNGTLVPVEVATMGVLAGGGEILSTGDDVKTLLLVLSGLQPAPVEGTVELAIEPVAAGEAGTDIAYSWNVTPGVSGGAPGYAKAGLTAGYTAYIVFRRDDPRGIAILSGRGGHMAIQAAALEMLAL